MFQKVKNLHLKFQEYYIHLILLLGLILRLHNILNRDFWYDEAFTGIAVKSNFWDMIRITINDVHPPLYYVLLKVFSSFFNYSVFGIRFFSLIFGLLGIWAVYLFTKELFNKKAALFASLITAVSPFAIQYSQEGRMYSMFSFLVVLSAYFLIKGLKSDGYRYYILWGIFWGLSLLTHYMGIIFGLLFYFIFILYNFFYKNNGKLSFKKVLKNIIPNKGIIAGYISAILIFSFWIKTFINHLVYSGLTNMHWVRPAAFSDIFVNAQIFIFGSPLGDLSSGMPNPNNLHYISSGAVLIGITLFLSLIVTDLFKKDKEKIFFVLILSLGFMLVIYALSLWGENYFVSRYLIAASYFFFVLIGVWLSRVSWKISLSALIIYFFLLLNIINLNYSKGYGELAADLGKYQNNNFYVLNSFDYVIAKYYIGNDHLILYNIDWPQYNPSNWAAIGPELKRTENYNDVKNDPRAIIMANIQKDKEKRNDKTFDPAGLPLIAKYDNITLYKPSN
jgi:uncharacterized membrane protein